MRAFARAFDSSLRKRDELALARTRLVCVLCVYVYARVRVRVSVYMPLCVYTYIQSTVAKKKAKNTIIVSCATGPETRERVVETHTIALIGRGWIPYESAGDSY